MLEVVQFLYLDNNPMLPVRFLNCGHASVSSSSYHWNGLNRGDSQSPLAIWQYTLSGCGAIQIDGKTHLLKPGMAFLVTVPDEHIYYLPENSERWEFLYLTVSGNVLIDLTCAMQKKFGKILHHTPNSQVVRKTLETIQQYKDQPLPDICTASAMAYEFWMTILNELSAESSEKSSSPLLETVVQYLQKNLHKTPCDVTELAAAAGYSRAHFTRKFSEECGVPPGKFLLDWRLHIAAQMLAADHSQIKSIAWQTGFTNVSHFCRVFRQKYGLSPKSFRFSPAARTETNVKK